MQTLDPAGEWLRLSEYYRQLSDDELVGLARQTSELTDVAQQALAQEIANRRLNIPPEESATPRSPEPHPDAVEDGGSPYTEDRELVDICTVWSLADALKLQRLLDTAGIPFYIGPEKAAGVDAVTSNFANGLSVQIMQVGVPWARQVLQQYFPADEPPEEKVADESDNLAIHCPKCHSTEVVFEDLDRGPENMEGKPSSKFKWTCDSCGHEWEDDGLVTED
jgi:DNA-directed RNA polymerase subunit M/transcription elongation factor TFIIS